MRDEDVEDEPEDGGIMGFVSDAKTIKVHPDLMRKATLAHSAMPPEDRRNLTMQMLSIIKIVEKLKRVKKQNRSTLAHAIHLRQIALSRLHDRPEMRGYSTEKDGEGCSYIHDDLLVAAAKAPLVQLDEYTIEFDADEFFKILLRDGRHDGTA